MDSLRLLLNFIILFFFVSCSKISYITEQTLGQLKLLNKAKENEVLLASPIVSKKHKDKIKNIIKYKKYFYSYWKKETKPIYSKTYILDQEAVTYLVISSKFDEVKSREECFPFAGCFPYLGFFKKESAIEYKKKMEEDHFYTYMRPVYAYSTLGYFDDPILSSFFYYSETGLIDLVFHELFHTIFFIKNEVELNENMASYFAKVMTSEYLNKSEMDKAKEQRYSKLQDQLDRHVVKYANKLKALYKNNKPKNKEESQAILTDFIENDFHPNSLKKCEELSLFRKDCYPLKGEWNNAKFSAYLTYQSQNKKLEILHKKLKMNLKQFLNYIEIKYEEYNNSSVNDKKTFSSYLFDHTIN